MSIDAVVVMATVPAGETWWETSEPLPFLVFVDAFRVGREPAADDVDAVIVSAPAQGGDAVTVSAPAQSVGVDDNSAVAVSEDAQPRIIV